MTALGYLIQLGGWGFLGLAAVGCYKADRARAAASRDCPQCRGVGCERCAWSGEVDVREMGAQGGAR